MKKSSAGVLGVAAATSLVLAGCSGGGDTAGGGEPADGAAFTMSLIADPGALDPQASAVNSQIQLSRFAYDRLVSIDADGTLGSQLAREWSVDGTTVTLTLDEDVTCADGSAFTGQTVVDNLNWIADPENQSPFIGSYFPPGSAAEAEGNTVTLTLAEPAPFALEDLAKVPMVCDAGLSDREALADGTHGTGPYVLSEAAPNDHYTYELREGYTWGPNGATSAESGLPATIVVRIVPDETTAANLLLSGEVNATSILGPDRQRVDEAGLFSASVEALVGEKWFNQDSGHATADPDVRTALTQALDLAELEKVLTGGTGVPATRLTVTPPSACDYDAVTENVPATDVDAAKDALSEAGWVEGVDGVRTKDGERLSLTFLYADTLGSGGSSAAELAVAQWGEIGVEVDAVQNDSTTLTDSIFGTGAWDIAWVPLNVSNPDQIIEFVSGPSAPDGNNFAGIRNDEYESAVADAMQVQGTAGCEKWETAEAELLRSADVVPFANDVVETYGNGAQFEMIDGLEPTSIRMLGS